jgi:hypothetical protein
MPAPVVHVGATVLCSHGGQAQPTVPSPRVMVSGQPVTLITALYVIAGCPFNVSGGPVPCVTGQWLVGSVRVLSMGQPLVIQTSASTCIPNGTPMMILVTQPRVLAT